MNSRIVLSCITYHCDSHVMFCKQKLVKIHAHNEETVECALIEAAGSDADANYNVSLHSNSQLYSDCTLYPKVEHTISVTA